MFELNLFLILTLPYVAYGKQRVMAFVVNTIYNVHIEPRETVGKCVRNLIGPLVNE